MERQSEIEISMMELGVEVFRLKNEMKEYIKIQKEIILGLKGLKSLLDEKGIIDPEELDAQIDLNQILEAMSRLMDVESDFKKHLNKKISN